MIDRVGPATLAAVTSIERGTSMIEHEITDLLMPDSDDLEIAIPAPRSGQHYMLWKFEVGDCHGCLDAPIGD